MDDALKRRAYNLKFGIHTGKIAHQTYVVLPELFLKARPWSSGAELHQSKLKPFFIPVDRCIMLKQPRASFLPTHKSKLTEDLHKLTVSKLMFQYKIWQKNSKAVLLFPDVTEYEKHDLALKVCSSSCCHIRIFSFLCIDLRLCCVSLDLKYISYLILPFCVCVCVIVQFRRS